MRSESFLTIRNVQLSVLCGVRAEKFIEDMVQALTLDHPTRFPEEDPSIARALVERVIKWADANHVNTEAGVAVLLQLVLAFGEDFELSPDRTWALDMLAHPTLPPSLKTGLLRQRMMETSRGRIVVPFVPGAVE